MIIDDLRRMKSEITNIIETTGWFPSKDLRITYYRIAKHLKIAIYLLSAIERYKLSGDPLPSTDEDITLAMKRSRRK